MLNPLPAIFYKRATDLADAVAVQYKEGRSSYRNINWTDYSRMVKELAFGLAEFGLTPGSCAAILSGSCHFWVASDLAILSAAGISVPIYPTSSKSDIEFILNNSEAAFVFVQNEELLNKILSIKESVPQLKKIIMLSPLTGGKSLSELNVEPELVIGIEELQEAGRQSLNREPELIDKRISDIKVEDTATIIYTSGTTGTPKGVMLTHANIVGVLNDLPAVIPIGPQDVYLSFLPLCHVFERVCGEFYWMHSGGILAFAEGIETVSKNMTEVQPTMILVVPRVLDRIYAKVKSGIQGASGKARKLIEWSLEVGSDMVRHQSQQKEPRAALKLKYWLAEKLVLSKMRSRIGQRLRMIVSGGAPATVEVIDFFNAIGINTLEGYGLTETAAPASVNRLGRVKLGTVGPALPSMQIKTDEDGELLMKGAGVFAGYFKNEEATREAFVDGWFRSGDIGTIDGDGYVMITDRKKDLIVSSAGKNIAPQKIEALLKTVPMITQAVVFGDRKKHLVALLTLEENVTVEFAREKNWNFENFEHLITLPELQQHLRQAISEKTAQLADYERIRNFAILSLDLSVESGELTATLKVKRNAVAHKYQELVEALYREENKNLVSSRR